MTVKERIKAYMVDTFLLGAPFTIGDGDSFLENDLMDSTGAIELVIWLDEEFGVVVEDDEMIPENLDSLDALEALIARKKDEQAAKGS